MLLKIVVGARNWLVSYLVSLSNHPKRGPPDLYLENPSRGHHLQGLSCPTTLRLFHPLHVRAENQQPGKSLRHLRRSARRWVLLSFDGARVVWFGDTEGIPLVLKPPPFGDTPMFSMMWVTTNRSPWSTPCREGRLIRQHGTTLGIWVGLCLGNPPKWWFSINSPKRDTTP